MFATESDLTEAVIFHQARGCRISMRSHSGEIDKMESVADRIVNRAQGDEIAQGGVQLVGVIEIGELFKVIINMGHNSVEQVPTRAKKKIRFQYAARDSFCRRVHHISRSRRGDPRVL